jgi:hypothetical protein
MSAAFCTGYINLNPVYRPHERYLELGRRMLACGEPTIAFIDAAVQDPGLPGNVKVLPARLEDCWLHRYREGTGLPPIRNPEKDSADFFAVQCQKSHWIVEAFRHTTADTIAWVDFGIMHLPDVEIDDLNDFYDQLLAGRPDKINIGSIWELGPQTRISFDEPVWYCAGGVFVVPRHLAEWFARAVEERMALHVRDTNQLTWEVGIWASVAQEHPAEVALYRCGHDRRLFTGYRSAAK